MKKSSNSRRDCQFRRFSFVVAALMLLSCSSQAQESSSPSSTPEAPVEWRTYTDKAYGFSIKYPATFIILREPKRQPVVTPRVVHRVRFQDKHLALSQTADLEPPQFSIEMFENDGSASLRNWLQDAIRTGENDTVEPVRMDGTGEGLRVRSAMQLAPNDFYYFARGKYIFRLTPLGLHGEEMLNSFRFQLNR